jgi:hypothetical protein
VLIFVQVLSPLAAHDDAGGQAHHRSLQSADRHMGVVVASRNSGRVRQQSNALLK